MKTLITTLIILALLSILFFLIRIYFSKEVEEPEEQINFEFIKPVSLAGSIRVFSLYGNHLADISEDGPIVYISSKSIGQQAEIRYIMDNYKTVYKQLAQ